MINNLKIFREKNNISQMQLANELGISQQAINKWETGESLPRADKLLQLAEILGCTVDELLKE